MNFTSGSKNEYLLITTVGERALEICRQWTSGARKYDVFLIYYDKNDGSDFRSMADFYVKKPGFKYPLIGKIIDEYPMLMKRYKYFYLPDDDIEMDVVAINRLFEFAKLNELKICQPSISPYNYSWECTVHNPYTKFRYVKMIEVMCPLFSRNALKKCLLTFQKSQSGWGLEPVWSKLLGDRDKSFAVYDEVVANHKHPVDTQNGVLYSNLKNHGIDPKAELNDLLREYNVKLDFYQIGSVYKDEFHQSLFDELIKITKGKDLEQIVDKSFSLSIALIRVLCVKFKVKLDRLIGFWDFPSFFKNYSYEYLLNLEAMFLEKKDVLIDKAEHILNNSDYSQALWIRGWCQICEREISTHVKSELLSEAILEKFHSGVFFVITDQVRSNKHVKSAFFYFIHRTLQHLATIPAIYNTNNIH